MRKRGSRGAGEQGRWSGPLGAVQTKTGGVGGNKLGSSAEVSPSPFAVLAQLRHLPGRAASQFLENLTPAPPLPNPPAPLPQAKAKHVPERTCAACRTKKPQGDLYRIRKTPGGWTMDRGVTVGRSVYLCSSPYCHVEKRLKRTFGAQAAQISTQISTRLSEVLRALEGQKEKLSGANIG